MASDSPSLKATDLLAVRSRISWGAIAAGAMVALAVYLLFTLLGLALGIEAAFRQTENLGFGAALYAMITLLLAMFLGGWTVSRLAVGESKVEAVLYGVILWGFLFAGMFWLVATGVGAGFGGLVSGVLSMSSTDSGEFDPGRFSGLLKRFGADAATVDRYMADYRLVRNDPAAVRQLMERPEYRDLASQAAVAARRASWWALAGVAASMLAVVFGSLVGSGELPVPVPVLGVRRAPRDPRAA